jgi:hypothetical protein
MLQKPFVVGGVGFSIRTPMPAPGLTKYHGMTPNQARTTHEQICSWNFPLSALRARGQGDPHASLLFPLYGQGCIPYVGTLLPGANHHYGPNSRIGHMKINCDGMEALAMPQGMTVLFADSDFPGSLAADFPSIRRRAYTSHAAGSYAILGCCMRNTPAELISKRPATSTGPQEMRLGCMSLMSPEDMARGIYLNKDDPNMYRYAENEEGYWPPLATLGCEQENQFLSPDPEDYTRGYMTKDHYDARMKAHSTAASNMNVIRVGDKNGENLIQLTFGNSEESDAELDAMARRFDFDENTMFRVTVRLSIDTVWPSAERGTLRATELNQTRVDESRNLVRNFMEDQERIFDAKKSRDACEAAQARERYAYEAEDGDGGGYNRGPHRSSKNRR